MSAKVCPNYGMRDFGGWGVRGFRAHCPSCGFLSKLYLNFSTARSRAESHRCAA